ncbi:hypothetical protein EB796_017959 [Bugula neritina]|uniref:Uncharacterized protein n=1 Tax=Bugula neritina TaxID=10212 RepID=A0A7J7ITZ1_BUGNE|nr:hypothetical protein EB796_024363 [Bugula neritina]KAF6023732.1 hypothetical protein EB796_017959 [Bugula neritina]
MNNISILFTVTKLILCASDIIRSIKTRQSSSSYCLLLNAAVYFCLPSFFLQKNCSSSFSFCHLFSSPGSNDTLIVSNIHASLKNIHQSLQQ